MWLFVGKRAVYFHCFGPVAEPSLAHFFAHFSLEIFFYLCPPMPSTSLRPMVLPFEFQVISQNRSIFLLLKPTEHARCSQEGKKGNHKVRHEPYAAEGGTHLTTIYQFHTLETQLTWFFLCPILHTFQMTFHILGSRSAQYTSRKFFVSKYTFLKILLGPLHTIHYFGPL